MTVVVGAGLLAAGAVLGSLAFDRTTTKVVVETRTVTIEAAPTNERTLRVQILDPEPRQADAATDMPFPLSAWETNARFPDIEEIAVHAPGESGGRGELVGLPDASTRSYASIADAAEEGVCVMQFDVPGLALSRFYIVHAGSDARLFQGGYTWRVSAAELERRSWSISLNLGS